MERGIVIEIALTIGVIVSSTIASFLLPGLGGLFVSGAIQLLGDIGIELYNGQFPSDPVWFLTEFLAVFGPYFQEIKMAKFNSQILRAAEKGIKTADRFLTAIDDAMINSIEILKNKSQYLFKKGKEFPNAVENEIKLVEKQEAAREKFGSNNVKINKRLESFIPNTKNPDSWIAGVGFIEKTRLGKYDIRGDLIISYYINNHYRVGYVKKIIKGAKIVLGRTSSGVRTGDNQSKYYRHKIEKKPHLVKIRKVVFKGARYYNDYLSFLKSHSWGGYYMRKWMRGLPGRKPGVNFLVVFGDAYRVWTKFRGITGDLRDLFIDSENLLKQKSKEFFGQTRLGSQYNKITGVWSKANAIKDEPISQFRDWGKGKAEQFRETKRIENIKRRKKWQ